MMTLVVGASGATGKHLVEELLKSGQKVKIIVRSTSKIPDNWNNNEQLAVIKKNISDISVEEISEIMADCQSVASCLGHNVSWKGIFGKPRKLVTDTVKLIYQAISKNANERKIKFVLMNTAGNSNRDLNENISTSEKIILVLLRLLLPPHPDNEHAADFLRIHVGQNNPYMEWVAVRPDNLVNHDKVSNYSIHQSPIRSAIFNPGKTSRINVANFMANLLADNHSWERWKGQMPVLYNDDEQPK